MYTRFFRNISRHRTKLIGAGVVGGVAAFYFANGRNNFSHNKINYQPAHTIRFFTTENIHFDSKSISSKSSENPIHFFHLGAVIQGLRLAILLKNDKMIDNYYYSQLNPILKEMELKCPSIHDIMKNEAVLLDPVNTFIYKNTGFLGDVYRAGNLVTMILNYNNQHPAYNKACSDFLEIGSIYGFKKEFNDWVSSIDKNDAQKNADEIEIVIKKMALQISKPSLSSKSLSSGSSDEESTHKISNLRNGSSK